MSSLFKGLDAFGMDDLDKTDLFEEKKEIEKKKIEKKKVVIKEEELLYDRTIRCPVCNSVFEARTIKQGVAKVVGTGVNLRPVYASVDQIRYDVVLCEICGYAALNRNFKNISERQVKLVKEKISMKYVGKRYPKVYDYSVALERYKMALYNDVVMGRSMINKAYLCLKASWVIESLLEVTEDEKKFSELKESYWSFVENAYKGFAKAYSETKFPIFGMNESTYQYMLGALAYELEDMKNTSFWLGKVMLSPISSARIKEKARELKALIDANKNTEEYHEGEGADE